MADLITHTCTALLWKAGTRGDRVAVFVAGTCAPDLLSRVPSMGLTWLRWQVPSIPEWLVYIWGPLHMPAGIAAAAVLLSFLFPEQGRAEAFRNLLGGGLLHLAVDLLQHHFGVGYLLLFPFSLWDYEVGLIGSEDTVLIVPILAPFTAWVAWKRWGPKGREQARIARQT
jgi:hypothetical protein